MGNTDQSATRRELIKRGVARAGGGDIGALQALARAEQVLVTSYEQVLAAGLLSPRASKRAVEFLAHERAHLTAIRHQLQRLGGTLPGPPGALGTAIGPEDERDAVRMLLALERAALSAYYAELAHLRDARAAQTAAEIMACEAQHATELRELLSPGDVMRAVPSSFVFGTP